MVIWAATVSVYYEANRDKQRQGVVTMERLVMLSTIAMALGALTVVLVMLSGCGCSQEANTDEIKWIQCDVSVEDPAPAPTRGRLAVDPAEADRYRMGKELRNLDAQSAKHQTIDRIAARLDESGTPCWIPEDLNCDGVIDVLDMIPVGQVNIGGAK